MTAEEFFEKWWTPKELPKNGFNKTAMLDFAEMYHKEQVKKIDKPLVKADVINLLPCPFCGSKAEKREREGIGDYDLNKVFYDIRCTNNECYLQDGAEWNCKTYEEVVAMWNKRK